MRYQLQQIINQIINDDCINVLRDIPDNSIDLLLTDPPYGIGESSNNNKSRGKLAQAKDYGNKNWDDKIPEKKYFDEMLRVSKKAIIFGGNYFVEYLENSSCWIVWNKNNGNNDFADCELAWTNFKTAVRKYDWTWNGMLQQNMKNKDIRIHPTQKPLGLFEKILLDYSRENDLILDYFSGSGTTAVACYNTNRKFICIEKDREYYQKSILRLNEIKSQIRLF
jgi:site-specific DNA-methyltransferase (adenine-specific)